MCGAFGAERGVVYPVRFTRDVKRAGRGVGAAGFSSLIFPKTIPSRIALSPFAADKPCSETLSRRASPRD